ncbi:thioredoxin family protein [Haloferula sp.]|uniref:thioredoxin family protein n=1 Tax=Haloferula sp. TaxID=2497595 RepID=UPI0032A0B348
MKAITHLAAFTLAGSALVGTSFANTLEGWSTDLDKAFKDAKAQDKPVLVEFTGSDWCPPCIMMRKKVFSQKEFVSAASKDFILVELDFPNGDPEVKKKNDPYAKKYKIEGFPTVILFDSDGDEFSRFYASEHPSTEAFLTHLKNSLEKKDLD